MLEFLNFFRKDQGEEGEPQDLPMHLTIKGNAETGTVDFRIQAVGEDGVQLPEHSALLMSVNGGFCIRNPQFYDALQKLFFEAMRQDVAREFEVPVESLALRNST